MSIHSFTNSPSDNQLNQIQPPEWMRAGPDTLSDDARKHLTPHKRSRLLSFLSSRRKSAAATVSVTNSRAKELLDAGAGDRDERQEDRHHFGTSAADGLDVPRDSITAVPVDVINPSLASEQDTDLYQWAIIYENQRGLMIFSVPYYSSNSLLPFDPPPYTTPFTGPSTLVASFTQDPANRPQFSPADYPLPDGNCSWVSKEWMIDMQGDGCVQHDGFEYNWFFRPNNWRSRVGKLSTGGWVRRRRWVRLMMRPAIKDLSLLEADTSRSINSGRSEANSALTEDEIHGIWSGDELHDWKACHAALRKCDRDGRRLELWCKWLCLSPERGEQRRQWTDDDDLLPSEVTWTQLRSTHFQGLKNPKTADLQAIRNVLNVHGKDILEMFIYPASRTQFLGLLKNAGLIHDLPSGALGLADFWSQARDLGLLGDNSEVTNNAR